MSIGIAASRLRKTIFYAAELRWTARLGQQENSTQDCCASNARISELRLAIRACYTRRTRRAREKLADFLSIQLEEGDQDELDNVGGTVRALLEIEHGGHGKELSPREIYEQASPAVGMVMGYAVC